MFRGNIIFPEGAGGNHLRWLLYLDPQYQDPFGHYVTAEQRAEFICTKVYGADRTWNTWLRWEWHYRTMLDGQINISHNYANWKDLLGQPTLFVTFKDYQLPLTHYFHINLGLNSTTPEDMLRRFHQRDQDLQNIKAENHKQFEFLFADCVFDAELNQTFYQQLTEFFGFDQCYEQAAQVHRAYTQCRQRSARDFVNYFNSKQFELYCQRLLDIC